MSQRVLISTFFKLAKPRFKRVALPAHADAGEHDAVVGAHHAGRERLRVRYGRGNQVTAGDHRRRGDAAKPRPEVAPGNIVCVIVLRH